LLRWNKQRVWHKLPAVRRTDPPTGGEVRAKAVLSLVMSNKEFARQFAGTSLLRAGRKKILSNYAVFITRSTH
jgi:epoxyqueuosine reductase QueG